MNTTREKIDIMQGYLDGKTIEYQLVTGEWKVLDIEPVWAWNMVEYRIKQEPIVRYQVVNHTGSPYATFNTEKEAIGYCQKLLAHSSKKIIKLVEDTSYEQTTRSSGGSPW